MTHTNNMLIWHIDVDEDFKTFIKKRIVKRYTDEVIQSKLKNKKMSLSKYSNTQIRNKLYKKYMEGYLQHNLKKRFCSDETSKYLFSKGLRYQFKYTFHNTEPFAIIELSAKDFSM